MGFASHHKASKQQCGSGSCEPLPPAKPEASSWLCNSGPYFNLFTLLSSLRGFHVLLWVVKLARPQGLIQFLTAHSLPPRLRLSSQDAPSHLAAGDEVHVQVRASGDWANDSGKQTSFRSAPHSSKPMHPPGCFEGPYEQLLILSAPPPPPRGALSPDTAATQS